jgi:hypothetical protein
MQITLKRLDPLIVNPQSATFLEGSANLINYSSSQICRFAICGTYLRAAHPPCLLFTNRFSFSAMIVIREAVPPEEWEHDDYLNDQKDAEREETMAAVLHTIPVLSSSQVLVPIPENG